MTNTPSPSTPDGTALDDEELKSAVEAAFGPGALALIEDESQTDGIVGAEASAAVDSAAAAGVDARPVTKDRSVQTTAVDPIHEQAQAVLLFELSDLLCAVPLANVVEVQRSPTITRIPRAPEWFSGLANVRGNIISTVDLERLLARTPNGENLRFVIIVRSLAGGVTTGLLVKRVFGIRAITMDGSDAPVSTGNPEDDLIHAIGDYDGDSVLVLDLEHLLHSSTLRQCHSHQV